MLQVLVTVLFERVLILHKPHKAKIWFTKKRALIGLLLLFLVVGLINSHLLIFNQIINRVSLLLLYNFVFL